jgi:hypothetical protein
MFSINRSQTIGKVPFFMKLLRSLSPGFLSGSWQMDRQHLPLYGLTGLHNALRHCLESKTIGEGQAANRVSRCQIPFFQLKRRGNLSLENADSPQPQPMELDDAEDDMVSLSHDPVLQIPEQQSRPTTTGTAQDCQPRKRKQKVNYQDVDEELLAFVRKPIPSGVTSEEEACSPCLDVTVNVTYMFTMP